jgi:hypothetical protein
MTKNINFLKEEIRRMKSNTWRNAHSENLLFLAKKIESPLHKKFKEIDAKHKQEGSLNYNLWNKRYALSQKLFKELKKKSPKHYGEVYSAF